MLTEEISAFAHRWGNHVIGKVIKLAVRLHNLQAMAASFQENNLVIDWVNNQPLASTLTCLKDGHDGRAEHYPRVYTRTRAA